MKRIFKYLTMTAVSGMLCMFLAFPANAQRGGHGGGGGGFHGGGGGGGFHGGGGFSGGARSGGFSGGTRSGGFSGSARVGSSVQGGRSFSGTQGSHFSAPQGGARNYAGAGVRGYAGVGTRGYAGVGARGYAGVGARGYAGVGARGFGVYGRANFGYGAFRARGGFYFNHGFYRNLYYPRLGFSVGFLPYGYYPFYWNDLNYYYDDGFFYNYVNDQYTVVEPPIGAAVNTLPKDAQAITINGQQYYEANGVYYMPITKDDGTVVYEVEGKDGQLTTTNGQDQQAPPANGDQQNYAPQPPNNYPPQQYNNGGQQNYPAQPNQPAAGESNAPHMGDVYPQLPPDCRKIRVNGQQLYVTPDDVYLKEGTDNNGRKTYTIVGVPSQQY